MRSLPDVGLADRTARLERVDLDTPAPLPPVPLADGPDGWFESVPTNPAPTADLAELAMSGGSVVTGLTPVGLSSDAESTRAIVKQRLGAVGHRPPWVLPALLSVTSLVVGMVLGALIFGSRPSRGATPGDCEPTDADDATAPARVGAATPVSVDRPGGCSLDISSSPAGADVTVDGRPVGKTPITATRLPCNRSVEVMLRKSHWQTARRTATPDRSAKSLDVALTRPRSR